MYTCTSVRVSSEGVMYTCTSVRVSSEGVMYTCTSERVSSEGFMYSCTSVRVSSEGVMYTCTRVSIYRSLFLPFFKRVVFFVFNFITSFGIIYISEFLSYVHWRFCLFDVKRPLLKHLID